MTGTELPPVSYKHPPITESVIGINFSSTTKLTDIRTVSKKFHAHYPHQQIVSNFDVAVEMPINQVNKVAANIHKNDGHRLSTDDMTQLLVFWPSSFTFSQLAPYPGWDIFFKRFVRDWGIWKRNIGHKEISRIGVRYINRVDIPIMDSITKYEEFLNVYPKLPESIDPLVGYAVQAASELKDLGCLLKINSAVVPSPILNHVSFVVDLDISKEINPPQSDNDIYDLLNNIRLQKNIVFEACITDRARELFQ
ncbi:MAG: TIGR04255 family protein [Pseudomonadota bacterium]